MSDSQKLHVPCPRCRVPVRWQDNPHRPFCSEKCRLIDLGRWADEEYRIPVQPGDADDFTGADDDRSEEED